LLPLNNVDPRAPSGMKRSDMEKETSVASIERRLARPWVSYVAVAALQLKIVWGAWVWRDLTGGDTAAYFAMSGAWFDDLKINILWSPLYLVYLGTVRHLTPDDAYLPIIAHRVILAVGVTLLVLGVLRGLLTPGLALLMSAWWAALPIVFNTAFEVHLFATIPVFAAWLVLRGAPSAWRRGTALAILAAGTILVRNELLIATLTFGAFCVVAERRAHVTLRETEGWRTSFYLKAYGCPLVIVLLLAIGAHQRSVVQFPTLLTHAAPKHTVNMCQAYAMGYKQRHPEWDRDHWTQCGELMVRDFGNSDVTLWEMIRRNPRAVAAYLAWNTSLSANGLQVTLFNTMSGAVTPDYGPVPINRMRAWLFSALGLATVSAGLIVLWCRPQHWRRQWLYERRWVWLGILAMVPVWLALIATQRPRPSYLLPLGLACMAAMATGFLLTGWLSATRQFPRLDTIVPWVLLCVFGLTIPPFYVQGNAPERPVLELYRRLRPFNKSIARSDTILVVNQYAFEMQYYVGRGFPRVIDYSILDPHRTDRELKQFLDDSDINLIYADEQLMASLRGPSNLGSPSTLTGRPEWKLIGTEDHLGTHWQLWRRQKALESDVLTARQFSHSRDVRSAPNPPRSTPPGTSAGIELGLGWYPTETHDEFVFRWASNDAQITFDSAPASRRLSIVAEAGPSARALPLELEVLGDAGTSTQRFKLAGRDTLVIEVAPMATMLRFHTDAGGRPLPTDPRILNFRVFRVEWLPTP
jgi:hypothetical protein